MAERRDHEVPSDEETTVVRRDATRRVVEEVEPAAPFLDPGPSYAEPATAVEEDRVRVHADGRVDHERERIERAPARRWNPFADFWPALALLLLAALIAIGILWYLSLDQQRAVPGVTGLSLDRAVARLQDEGFKTDIVSRASSAPEGRVFEQGPTAGTELEEGSSVTVVVSRGPATITVPNAVGLSEQEGRDRLAAAGLAARVFEVFSDEPEGTVIAQNPGSGERVAEDAEIRLNVSKGSGLVEVPAVVGLTRASAEAELAAVRLKARVFEVPSAEPEGRVVAQNPTGGKLREGSAVRLNVSTGRPAP